MSKIEINNVYKIFGSNPQSVMPMVKDGANKEEVLEQTGHTVGLDNVSLKNIFLSLIPSLYRFFKFLEQMKDGGTNIPP